MKDVDEINWYFTDFSENELPERDYLVTIISTINPEATKEIISQAQEKRSIKDNKEKDNLVKVSEEMHHELSQMKMMKSKFWTL